MKLRKVALCLVAAAIALPSWAASPVKPGKWQVKMETEMPGMPIKLPPVTITQCVTKEMAENPEAALPKSQGDKSSCKIGDYKIDGSTVTWTMNCPKENIKGTGTITYNDDSYTGGMKMTMGETQMSAKYTGKRLGDCEK